MRAYVVVVDPQDLQDTGESLEAACPARRAAVQVGARAALVEVLALDVGGVEATPVLPVAGDEVQPPLGATDELRVGTQDAVPSVAVLDLDAGEVGFEVRRYG